REAVAGHGFDCNCYDGGALNRQVRRASMRFGDSPESENFEDRTGQSGGGGLNLGGGMGMILSLVASRFGIVGVLILVLGYCALTQLGGGGMLGGGSKQEGPSKLDPATGK